MKVNAFFSDRNERRQVFVPNLRGSLGSQLYAVFQNFKLIYINASYSKHIKYF